MESKMKSGKETGLELALQDIYFGNILVQCFGVIVLGPLQVQMMHWP